MQICSKLCGKKKFGISHQSLFFYIFLPSSSPSLQCLRDGWTKRAGVLGWTADVAPSPRTARWRLYLSLSVTQSFTRRACTACAPHTHRCMPPLPKKHARWCINERTRRKVHCCTPGFRFMCLHLQTHNIHWSMQKNRFRGHVRVLTTDTPFYPSLST